MRITEAAERLGTSPRMLRYRELLGLLPPVRDPLSATHARFAAAPPRRGTPHPGNNPTDSHTPGTHKEPNTHQRHTRRGGPAAEPVPGTPAGPTRTTLVRRHRRFSDDDLAAAGLALGIERRYDVSPAALAFGLRVLTESGVRAEVAELGRLIGKIGPPARALEFEKERALRLLNLTGTTLPRP